jgi:hypothetical protein
VRSLGSFSRHTTLAAQHGADSKKKTRSSTCFSPLPLPPPLPPSPPRPLAHSAPSLLVCARVSLVTHCLDRTSHFTHSTLPYLA